MGQLLLSVLVSLIWLGLLAVIALLWLRAVIHLGLLEEASEREIGPDVVCANCGRATPSHTFCGWCGVSLRAAPKAPKAPVAPPGARDAGATGAGAPGGPAGGRP